MLAMRQEIAQGRYPSGSRVGSEYGLCERFGASRGTVRRAVERLVADGYLEVRPGSGLYACHRPAPVATSRTISAMFDFCAESLVDAQEHALARGYLLCVYSRNSRNWDPAPERAFLERVREERHQGLLACCTPTEPVNDDLLRRMEAEGIRVVHIEPCRMAPPDQAYVLPDYRRAGYMATTTLMLAGYEEIVFAGCDSDWPGARLFLQGFIDAIDDHGGGYDPKRHYYNFPSGAGDYPQPTAALHAYLDTRARSTGFVCRSLDFAQAIRAAGRRAPEQFGVVAIRYLMETYPLEDIDCIVFDRKAHLQRAIDVLIDGDLQEARELIAPTLVRHGSVRG